MDGKEVKKSISLMWALAFKKMFQGGEK